MFFSYNLHVVNVVFDAAKLPLIMLELYFNPAYKEFFLRDIAYYKGNDFPSYAPPEADFSELEEYALRLAQWGQSSGGHCAKLGLFMVFLSRLCDTAGLAAGLLREDGASTDNVPLDIPNLTTYLERNFRRTVYLDELAAQSAMSSATLLRYFRAALGMTPMAYLLELRLRHAAELLINTRLPIKEVAEKSGFVSLAYFFRAFRKAYGMPPMAYRTKQ